MADPAHVRPEGAGTLKTLVARVKALVAWGKSTRIGRAFTRYGESHGGILAGGVAYSMVFSLFAALTLGYTAFMMVLGSHEELRHSVIEVVDKVLPGVLDTGDGTGGAINPDDLVATNLWSWTGLIALVVLIVSASSGMGSLRASIRVMFGEDGPRVGSVAESADHDVDSTEKSKSTKENVAVSKLRELVALIGLGLSVLVSAALTLAVTSVLGWAFDEFGWSRNSTVEWLFRVAALLVAFLVDALAFMLLFKVLAGVKTGWRQLVWGALLGACATSILRIFSAAFIGNVGSRNAFLASFATFATILVWINLLVRAVLIVSAWTANPQIEESIEESEDSPAHTP